MAEKEFLPSISLLVNTLKDLRVILDMGKKLSFPLPLTSLHAQALMSEVAKGRMG